MFAPAIEDLAKPQWIAAMRTLKAAGGMSISQLASALDVSYMAAKQYGEDLTRLGYLVRIRTPRAAVGRPEIFYRASQKADTLFPSVAMDFSFDLLEISKQLYGENAPERIIFQYFESRRTQWRAALESMACPHERARELAALRGASGIACNFDATGGPHPRFVELHHPLENLFKTYPATVAMDARCIAEALKTRVERVESKTSNAVVSVNYEFPDMPADPACRET